MQHTPGQFLSIPLLALGMSLGGTACARDGDAAAPFWKLSGFGTVGVVHSSEKHADYTSSVLKASGAGATREWSPHVDSRLGAQLDLNLNRRWSVVVQVVSEQGLDNSYRPRVEWANIKYQASPELALRAGRIALPMFLTADYRKLGYAYPWVRPPVEGYGSMPFTSSDGVDATWRWSAGPVRNASQVFYGRDDVTLIAPQRAHARKLVGLSDTADWGALQVRANIITADLSADIGDALFDAFDAFGAPGRAIGARYRIAHKRGTIASIGANYDPGAWFLMAEASRTRSATLLGSTRSMYASAGLRRGAWTPYLTWSLVHAAGPTASDGLPLPGLPPPAAAGAAQLNAGLNLLLGTIPQQHSLSAGLRWDLMQSVDLKLQYDRVAPRHGSRGTLINLAPGFRSERTAHVASVALDFVY